MNLLLDYRPALRDRTGVGEWVHQLALNLLALKAAGDPAAAGVALTLWSSSWRDRPAPSALRELNGATFVDRRVPVGPLTWAWNRVGWPPIEALTSRRFDVVHSTTPLLLPARSGLRVCTVYDLDFLSHPDRTRAEMRRDFPRPGPRAHREGEPRGHDLGVLEEADRTRLSVCRRSGLPCAGPACRPGSPGRLAPRPAGFAGPHALRRHPGAAQERPGAAGRLPPARRNDGRTRRASCSLDRSRRPRKPGSRRRRKPPARRDRVVVEGYVSNERRAELYAGASLPSCCRRSTKASACPPSRPWRSASRLSPRTSAPCPKSWATPAAHRPGGRRRASPAPSSRVHDDAGPGGPAARGGHRPRAAVQLDRVRAGPASGLRGRPRAGPPRAGGRSAGRAHENRRRHARTDGAPDRRRPVPRRTARRLGSSRPRRRGPPRVRALRAGSPAGRPFGPHRGASADGARAWPETGGTVWEQRTLPAAASRDATRRVLRAGVHGAAPPAVPGRADDPRPLVLRASRVVRLAGGPAPAAC